MRLFLVSLVLAWPLFAQDTTATAVVADTVAPVIETAKKPAKQTSLKNSVFDTLSLGGTFQLKGFYHNFTNENDLKKELSFSLSKFRLELSGVYNQNFGVLGQFDVEANGKNLGIGNAYGYYKRGFYQIKAGKQKKPFSMEVLQSTSSLYTVDLSQLYSGFLIKTTGYGSYDLGVSLKGGFVDEGTELTYEAGVYNGKNNNDGTKNYSGGQFEEKDAGFKSKDFAGRVALKGFGGLEADLAFSTKTAEVENGAGNLDLHANAAYEAGLAYTYKGLRAQGEIAWGSNHKGFDSNIVNVSSEFLAFYTMLIWKHQYSQGRASEAVVRWEGLDPDMTLGSGGGKPNDGKFRYTVGMNYFFSPKISVLLNYGILHPVTKIEEDNHWSHDVDAMWRLNF